MSQLNKNKRVLLAIFSISALVLVFLFQRYDVAGWIGIDNRYGQFVFNRSLRFLINDSLAILLIYALFSERKFVVFAVWVQVLGTVFILIPYFILKFNYPSYNGPTGFISSPSHTQPYIIAIADSCFLLSTEACKVT